MPDIASIFISVVIVALLVAALYWFLLKPSGEEVSTNILTIQKSIATLNESLAAQDVDIKDITSNVIPTVQNTINESMDKISNKLSTLSIYTDSKNDELSKLIKEVKVANEELSKTTTVSATTFTNLLNTLQVNFDMFVKKQADAFSNLSESQKTEIAKIYTAIDTGLKSRDTSIETLQRNIEKSIEVLNKTVTDKNSEFTTLISNLKKAQDLLSETTTKSLGTLQTTLQGNLNTLQVAFDKFVKLQADEIKRLDEKDQTNFDILNKKINDLQASEAAETKEVNKLIKDLIAQEKANFDTLSKKFPEISSTITEIKNNSQKMIDDVQKRIDKNDASDTTYNSYVDAINSYIDNALDIPEISDKVKKRIFTKRGDKVIEFLTKIAANTRDGKGRDRFSEVFIRDMNQQLRTLIERKTGFMLPEINGSVLSISKMYLAKTFPEVDEDANDIITMIEFISSPEPTYNTVDNTISGPVINKISSQDFIPVVINQNSISYKEFRDFAVKYNRALFDKTMYKKLNITDDGVRMDAEINTLFPEDYAMELFNLPEDKRFSYAIDKYNRITGCKYFGTSYPSPDKILAMIKKNPNDKELYELLWLNVFIHFIVDGGRGKRNMVYSDGNFLRTYYLIQDETVKKRDRDSDDKQTAIFNTYLSSIKFPLITRGPNDDDNYSYSYKNTKEAFIRFFRTTLTNCNVLIDVFKGTLSADDVCRFANMKYEDTCPVDINTTSSVQKVAAAPAASADVPAKAAVPKVSGVAALEELTARTNAQMAEARAKINAALAAAAAKV